MRGLGGGQAQEERVKEQRKEELQRLKNVKKKVRYRGKAACRVRYRWGGS